jgi:hypothetical protein
MMIQIDHRESHDVDIFLDDPQLLPYLDPSRHDFTFEIVPSDYGGDGTGFLKLSFDDGEIDFIVGNAKTPNPATLCEIEGQSTLLETIPEIITKKIVYRGSNIKPRDIFDIAAASEYDPDAIISALRSYPGEIAATIDTINRLNPEFTTAVINQLMIRDKYRPIVTTAIERAKELLLAV